MLNTYTFIKLIRDYLDYLNSFGLMFSLHVEVKLQLILHCEVTHIQRFFMMSYFWMYCSFFIFTIQRNM